MNFGHGDEGFGACPSAKSYPVAEYSTVLSVSTPSAFDAFAMTPFASCADVVQPSAAASETAARTFLFIIHPPFDGGLYNAGHRPTCGKRKELHMRVRLASF